MNLDYDTIASRYDQYRHGGGPYLGKLAALAEACGARRVLGIGAGTGNNTQVFLEARPCTLVALDLSRGMLAAGKQKGIPAAWVQGAASEIPLQAGSVSFVFGVYVLHHVRDLDAVFRECARVLDSGCAAFVTASTDFIERHPMNRYFPSFARVDKARFQPLDAIEAAFRRSGFAHVEAERFVDAARPITREYVERVANKFISTYDLLPPDEFAKGVERLRVDVAEKGQLETPIIWESVTIWARK